MKEFLIASTMVWNAALEEVIRSKQLAYILAECHLFTGSASQCAVSYFLTTDIFRSCPARPFFLPVV